MSPPRRRDVLAGLATAVLGTPWRSEAADARFGLTPLAVPGLQDTRPGALLDWLQDLSDNTSARTMAAADPIDPASQGLFLEPCVVLTGASAFPPLSEAAVTNLRLYLRQGGFLFVDDQSGRDDSPFDTSARRELARILPAQALVPVGRDHAVYRSFFLLRGVAGRVIVRPQWSCIWNGSHSPVLYSRNDLLGAIWNAARGGLLLDVIPGGEEQRRESRRWAVNIALYALTLDYKKDAVHVETLLERMRRDGGYLP